jgi:hypothetical protein
VAALVTIGRTVVDSNSWNQERHGLLVAAASPDGGDRVARAHNLQEAGHRGDSGPAPNHCCSVRRHSLRYRLQRGLPSHHHSHGLELGVAAAWGKTRSAM